MALQPSPNMPNEARLELLLDSLADYAIYTLDHEGFITTWNAGAERLKGYRAAEILGQHFSIFFTPEDLKQQLPAGILRAGHATGRYESEGWRVRKDGSRFWCNAVLQAVRDQRGKLVGFAKITRDFTERMAAQEALLESERRFRILVEGVVDYAICMLDPSGIVTNWNTGAERLGGYTADEIIGHHFSTFYTQEDRARGSPAKFLGIATHEGRFEAESWRVRKDGSRFWASVVIDAVRDSAGQLQGFAEITRDITERRAAQDAVRDSERQFRMLVAGVTDYALYMLDPNGIISSWNAGAERIKGYSADEIIGQHFSRFYTERDRAVGLPARALEAAKREGRFEIEGWRVRKDGTMFWANAMLDPIRDETGRLIGFAKITRDMTERRNAQIALQKAQVQRAQTQKMEALGQLTGGVAHDFNNLLMVVSGQLPLLKRRLGDDPKTARSVQSIELAVQRGATLTRQLLTFARRQTFNPEVCDIAERVNGFGTMLASSLGSSVSMQPTIGPDIWPVKVDPSEFELAMVNMALNARDAMPKGGVIAITAENVVLRRDDNRAGIARADVEGEFVALHVADTGTGIAPDVLLRVFDPFFTTKQSDKGSGLGLSQVHGFAHQSGGTVAIDSELGKGTTVTIYLPRTIESAATAEAGTAPEEAANGSILVVEDNPEVAEVTAALLQEIGYTVQMAGDAAAALDQVGSRAFDLVISDIVMAGAMNGIELAREIRQRKPDLPVLLVTGYSQVSLGPEDDFSVLRKPVELAELSRVTARIIAESRQARTPT